MGGTNDPSNLVDLTIEEHAEAHRLLYEQSGNEKDKIAWLGLSGLVPKQEVMKELYKLGRRKTDNILFQKYGIINPGQLDHVKKLNSERSKKLHKEGKLKVPDWTGKKHSEASKQKMKISAEGKHIGDKNSQYGTCWITNGQENKKIKKEELDKFIELGYYKGRIIAGLV